MNKFIAELKRRNVIKATISYVVFAWALIQIISLLVTILELGNGVSKVALIVLIIALPFWIVFAYIYEWTPTGFKKTDNVSEDTSIHDATSKKLNHYIIGGLVLLIVLLVVDRVFDFTGDMINTTPKTQVIAVLPFSDESETEENDFFSTGIYKEIVSRLSNVKDFRIIARSAMASYKDYEGDLSTIGKRFDANYILQASVRRNQDKVRLTASLVNAENNQTEWSNIYDGELADVFDLQTDMATKIAQQLQANLSQEEKDELNAKPTDNLKAYEDYLLGRHVVTQPNAGFEDYNEGVRILERAVAADPKFASAWNLIVEIQSVRYDLLKNDPNNQEAAEEAKKATYDAFEKANALAPNDPAVLASKAFILKNIEQDPLGALSAFEKTIEQNPSDYNSLKEAAFLYTMFDQPLKSKAALEKAFALTQDNGYISFQLTFAYEIMGEYEKMVPVLEKLAKYYPEEKHYAVEAKYYQFLSDGKLSSFNDFKATIENTTTEFPWDERAVKNKAMVVAMFDRKFEDYHNKWHGHMAAHTASHNGWVCPMVANDNLNEARLVMTMGSKQMGRQMLQQVEDIVLRPINLYSVCTFNPDVYLPKLDFLKGNEKLARQKLDEVALKVIQNKSFPTGAVERAILVQAADMISADKAYSYYKQVTDNTISFVSFESICADPWTFPNLIKDPRFQEEIKADGRFVDFLDSFGLLTR